MLDLDAIRTRAERYYWEEELADDVIVLLAEMTAARQVVNEARMYASGDARLAIAIEDYDAAAGGKP
jgi:hypothetical protein